MCTEYKRSATEKKELVEDICNLLDKGYNLESIFNEVGLNADNKRDREFLYGIWKRKYYTNISDSHDFNTYVKNKFTEDEVHEICKMLEDGFTVSEIVKIKNLENTKTMKNIIMNIRDGLSYTYISQYYDMKHSEPKVLLSEELVHQICKLIAEGKKPLEIVNTLGLENTKKNRGKILDIKRGISYRSISSKYF